MLQDGEGVLVFAWHGRTERGLVVDVEELDPSENSFSVHQRVRVAIDRLHNTGYTADNAITAMCQATLARTLIFQYCIRL
jgi:hypothetical protein